MYKRLSTGIFLLFASAVLGQGFDPNYRISFRDPVLEKNFYLLSLIQGRADVRKTLNNDGQLKSLLAQRSGTWKQIAACPDTACYDRVLRFNPNEIKSVAERLREMGASDKSLSNLADKNLRASGMFIKYDSKSNGDLLAQAWVDAAAGINHILDVYGLGKDALYKEIDNASYDTKRPEYFERVKTGLVKVKAAKNELFFEPSLAYALLLLEINGRDEAGRHEPLEQKDNKKAVDNLKNIKWADYPYTVIVVLGSGPSAAFGDPPNIAKIGMARADEGVKLFQQKQAPLIIFSGGYVHPARTPYCEGIEMKKYVMQKYGIPEENILVEPQARHTTTNIRNAIRIMFRDGIPTDKKGIITSTDTHVDYVMGETFVKRNMDELGYLPMKIFARISPVAVEFLPLIVSLSANSMEPLDP